MTKSRRIKEKLIFIFFPTRFLTNQTAWQVNIFLLLNLVIVNGRTGNFISHRQCWWWRIGVNNTWTNKDPYAKNFLATKYPAWKQRFFFFFLAIKLSENGHNITSNKQTNKKRKECTFSQEEKATIHEASKHENQSRTYIETNNQRPKSNTDAYLLTKSFFYGRVATNYPRLTSPA